MRTYDLTHVWTEDDGKITVRIETEDLKMIVAALRHCARGSHRNVMREVRHSISSVFELLVDLEGILKDEQSKVTP